MKLREALHHYKRSELIELAEMFDLELTNKSKKPRVLDQLVEFMTSEDNLRERMTCLTDEELDYFIKLAKRPLQPYDIITTGHFRLKRLFLADFDEVSQQYVVYEDVYETFKKIYDESFKQDQRKKGWLIKCSRFLLDYYTIAPVEVFHQLYQKKFNDSIDEMIKILSNIPLYVLSVDYDDIDMGNYGWEKGNKIYSKKGIVFSLDRMIDDSDEIGDLLIKQDEIDFYIPTREEIDLLYNNLYDIKSNSYQKLYDFFCEQLELSDEDALYWCSQLWGCVSGEDDEEVNELLKAMVQELRFENEEQIKWFVELYADAHNNTRMLVLRGHTPKEIMEQRQKLDDIYH